MTSCCTQFRSHGNLFYMYLTFRDVISSLVVFLKTHLRRDNIFAFKILKDGMDKNHK